MLFENFRYSGENWYWPIIGWIRLFTTFKNMENLCNFQLRWKFSILNTFIISFAIDGDNESTTRFIILGPRQSSPVALDRSNLLILLRSAMAGRLYKLQSKQTSKSGFDQTFMPCSSYNLFAVEQRTGYQISGVDLQREVNCPWNLQGYL